MARQEINLGSAPTGEGGANAREAFSAINQMTEELYSADQSLDARVADLEQQAGPGGTVSTVGGVSPDSGGDVPAASLAAALGVPTAPGDIGAATAAQGALAETSVQPAALAAGLDDKVDKQAGYGLSQANFTQAEKDKLAGLEGSKFQGLFTSLVALELAVPTGQPGFYAHIDPGGNQPTSVAIWDEDDAEWIIQAGGGGEMTPAQIKDGYESNPDTNAFTDAEKSKLAGVAAGATANASNAELRDRATHTGSQAISTVTGLSAQIDRLSFVAAGLDGTSDFNDLITAGPYALLFGAAAGSRNPNHPDGQTALAAGNGASNYYWLEVLAYGTNRMQIATPYLTAADTSKATIKFRYRIAGTWNSWTALARMDAVLSNPMATAGDIIVGGASGAPERLAKGGIGQFLGIQSDGNLGYISSPIVAVEYLVVGGGGSGGPAFAGSHGGGGGGGGGVQTGSATLVRGTILPVVVGSGGAAVASNTGGRGNMGGQSSFNGLTASGGGGGAGSSVGAGNLAATGGATGGGGNVYNVTGAAGGSGQGFAGGNGGGVAGSSGVAGGGGGAGAVGGNSSSLQSGAGGAGVASNISGVPVTYGGGGGGGGGWTSSTTLSGAGGAGGGGAGGGAAGTSTVGAGGQSGANGLGGGGGGMNGGATANGSGAGGSGVVIIRYAGVPRATGGIITQVSGYTIHTFTSSGNFEVSP